MAIDISGTWYAAGNGAVMTIVQNGNDIESQYTGGTQADPVYHSLKGIADGDEFEYTLKRTYQNCVVILYGMFSGIEGDKMIGHVYKSSGTCGFLPYFTETLTWIRVDP